MNVNTFSCSVLSRHFHFCFILQLLEGMRRFTWLVKLQNIVNFILSLRLLHTTSAKEKNVLLCHHEKRQSRTRAVNHPVAAIEVWSRVQFRRRSSSVWKNLQGFFLSTGFSFIRFHVLLLSYIFQLFTNLEWLPSPGLPACQIDQALPSEETLCLWACLCMRLPHNLKSDVTSRGLSTHLNDLTPLT